MNSHKILIFTCCLVCVLPHVVGAQIVVTEIMYDPIGSDTGHEWIEIYNAGTSSVSITNVLLYEGGSNHKIKSVQGGAVLASSTYAVIADNATIFRTDVPNFTGQLFDSSFSLGNDGDTFALKDKKLSTLETVTYSSSLGGQGNGNSLQRSPNDADTFVARAPSPGFPASTFAIVTPVKSNSISVVKKTSKPAVTKAVAPKEIVGETSDVSAVTTTPSTAVAGAAVPVSKTPYAWWVGVLVAVGVVACATVVIRHTRSDEWDIVEESPEDV